MAPFIRTFLDFLKGSYTTVHYYYYFFSMDELKILFQLSFSRFLFAARIIYLIILFGKFMTFENIKLFIGAKMISWDTLSS